MVNNEQKLVNVVKERLQNKQIKKVYFLLSDVNDVRNGLHTNMNVKGRTHGIFLGETIGCLISNLAPSD